MILPLIKRARERNKGYQGIVRLRELPGDWTIDLFKYWWLPERNSDGVEVRKPRMGKREKERYAVAEHHNTLTILGKGLLLSYMSVPSGAQPFGAYFSVGTGYCPGVSPNDTGVTSELYRQTPTGYLVQGNETDISIFFNPVSALGAWTNAGLYGGSASGTLGTGTLCTKTLYTYLKTSLPVTNDYLIVQS